MPIATGRSRQVTVQGIVEERRRREFSAELGENVYQRNFSTVNYFGAGVIAVQFGVAVVTEDRAGPQRRYTFTPQVTYSGPYGVGGTLNGTPQTSDWFNLTGSSAVAIVSSYVEAEFEEVSTLAEYVGHSEQRENVVYGIQITECTASIELTPPDGSGPVAFSFTDPSGGDSYVNPGVEEAQDDYSVELKWNPQALLASQPQTPLGGLPVTGVRAACAVTCDGLVYPTDALNADEGDTHLDGTPQDASLGFDGTALWHEDAATHFPVFIPPVAWNNWFFPQASVLVRPQWRVSVTGADLDYEDGSAVPAVVNHWGSGVLQGSYTSPGPYLYPAAGAVDTLQVAIDDGSIFVRNDPFGPNLAGYASISDSAEPAATGEVSRNNPIFQPNGSSLTHSFEPDETWADSYGSLCDSTNFGPGGKRYRIPLLPVFEAGRITFAATHAFQAFAAAAQWSAYAGAAFLALNPTYDGAGTVATQGSGLRFTTTGKTLFARSVNLKCFSYRYVKLRVRSPAAGFRFRFCLGDTNTSPNGPRYAWEVTVDEADTWQDVTLDLAFPGKVDTTAALSWPANSSVVHLDTWGPLTYPGASLWLDVYTTGTLDVESLTGFYRPDGVGDDPDREPLRVQGPLECAGSYGQALNLYDAPNPGVTSFVQVLARIVANGTRAFHLGQAYDSTADPEVSGDNPYISAFWTALFNRIDSAANDTGITVVVGTGDFVEGTGNFNVYETTLPVERAFDPGTDLIFNALHKAVTLAGYYGMGLPGGDYGEVLDLTAERVWNGSACGLVYDQLTPQEGVTVQLVDDDTGAVTASGVSDADGFYRAYSKYGVVSAYSNAPRGGSAPARFQGNSSGTYTAAGKLLNAWWVRGDFLTELKDSAGYLATGGVTRRQFVVLDRFPSWYDFGGSPAQSVDLWESQAGWLYRSYRDGTNAAVQQSVDAGNTWPGGTVGSDAAGNAAPTLVGDHHDGLLLWYHNSSGQARAWRRNAYGGTWADHVTLAGTKRFPRAAWRGDRLVLAAHDGSVLRIYTSGDHGATVTELTTLSMPEQLVSLRCDRRLWLHLVYRNAGGSVCHRYSRDGGATWSAESVWATGQYPGYAVGLDRGLVAYFAAGSLVVALTDETYGAISAIATAPAGAWQLGNLGVWVDRHLRLWIQGRVAGVLTPRWSRAASEWSAPS